MTENTEKLINNIKYSAMTLKRSLDLTNVQKSKSSEESLPKLDIILDSNTAIKELDQEESSRYLVVNEKYGIQHAKAKEKTRKEY